VHLPAPELREYVTFYYFVTAPGPIDDFLYPEWGNIRFALHGDWHVTMEGYGPEPQVDVLFGPTDRCGRVTTSGGRVVGLGLTPIGWHRLLGESAHLMANRVRTMGDELGAPASRLRRAFALDRCEAAGVARLDEVLGAVIARRPPTPALLLRLDDALRTRPQDVVRFAGLAGVSPRRLQRLCLAVYGFAPKRLIRRQRFLDTLGKFRMAVGEPLETAIDPKYFDQAHFYRDFRDFMGMSPRTYFKASRVLMRRAAEAQRAADVTLSFELPPTSDKAPPAKAMRPRRPGEPD
jgi:AraC-like DNA-binding protein